MFTTRLRARLPARSIYLIRRQSTAAESSNGSRAFGFASVGAASFALGWYAYDKTSLKSKDDASYLKGKAVPNLDPQSGYPFDYLSPPSPKDINARLNGDTWSVSNPSVDGVARYDGSCLPSNGPCEDRSISGRFSSPFPWQPNTQWMAWGVFDGHLGSQTSQALTQHLVPYVHTYLKQVAESAAPSLDDATIHKAIKEAFLALDKAFVQHGQETVANPALSFATKVQRLATASNGSCAILSLFDPSTRKLHVACTGDSRAVLGRQAPDGKWETIPLSVDQGGGNPDEIKRIAAEHPDEDIDGIVKDGRVLGLATARAFGDAHWKWPLELQKFARERFLSDVTRVHKEEVYKSPPYITAEPEVTTTTLPAGKNSFMIMASDGLWDTMSSEQAVDLISRWLEWKESGRPAKPTPPPKGEKWDKFQWSEYYSSGWKVVDETITVQDKNAAVHLTRNALGGANQDLVSALLAFKPPYSRWVRDDITVQVVFFD